MAMAWKKVLYFPHQEEARICPLPANMDRSQVTAISLPISKTPTQAATQSSPISTIKEHPISSLSAGGFKIFPNLVIKFFFRAIKPSSQSVKKATVKMTAANRLEFGFPDCRGNNIKGMEMI